MSCCLTPPRTAIHCGLSYDSPPPRGRPTRGGFAVNIHWATTTQKPATFTVAPPNKQLCLQVFPAHISISRTTHLSSSLLCSREQTCTSGHPFHFLISSDTSPHVSSPTLTIFFLINTITNYDDCFTQFVGFAHCSQGIDKAEGNEAFSASKSNLHAPQLARMVQLSYGPSPDCKWGWKQSYACGKGYDGTGKHYATDCHL